jgi:FG-GAP-like repeat
MAKPPSQTAKFMFSFHYKPSKPTDTIRGARNATFMLASSKAAGGLIWKLVLGDVNGDGDLDWVASSFGADRWYVLTINGSGAFTVVREIPADNNASCASLYDFDNDGDLDMALTDEVADVILLIQNGNQPLFSNGFETTLRSLAARWPK